MVGTAATPRLRQRWIWLNSAAALRAAPTSADARAPSQQAVAWHSVTGVP